MTSLSCSRRNARRSRLYCRDVCFTAVIFGAALKLGYAPVYRYESLPFALAQLCGLVQLAWGSGAEAPEDHSPPHPPLPPPFWSGFPEALTALRLIVGQTCSYFSFP